MDLKQRYTLIPLFNRAANIGKKIASYATLSSDSSSDTMLQTLKKLQADASALISTLTEIAATASRNKPDVNDESSSSGSLFCHEIVKLCRDKYALVMYMPTPLPRYTQRKVATLRYPYRSELQRSLIRHRPDLGFFPKENHLVFLFAKGPDESGALDHDNYYVKPIIDTITNSLGLSDEGINLALTYYSTYADEIEHGLYVMLTPGQNNPISKSEAICRCAAAKWLNQ